MTKPLLGEIVRSGVNEGAVRGDRLGREGTHQNPHWDGQQFQK
jgi:hypothetical protein